MRKVKVFATFEDSKSGIDHDFIGDFHEFSTDSEELRDGVGHYPVALIESPLGKMHSVPLQLFTFIED